MKDADVLESALSEAYFLLSKQTGDAAASAIEHLAGAVLLAAVISARRSSGDQHE